MIACEGGRCTVQGPVTLENVVALLAEGEHFAAGLHELAWNGRDRESGPVAAGAYFVRVRVGVETRVRKVTLVR